MQINYMVPYMNYLRQGTGQSMCMGWFRIMLV